VAQFSRRLGEDVYLLVRTHFLVTADLRAGDEMMASVSIAGGPSARQ
jgi:hypothetical protein